MWNYGCGDGDPGIAMDWAYSNESASESLYSFKQYGTNLVPQFNTNTLMSFIATTYSSLIYKNNINSYQKNVIIIQHIRFQLTRPTFNENISEDNSNLKYMFWFLENEKLNNKDIQ